MSRGVFQFQTTADGDLTNSAENVEALRRLWLHHSLVYGEDIGPGDRGDFAVGAWHSSCHLAGAAAVRRAADGGVIWLEISHDPRLDEYFASATHRVDSKCVTLRVDSAEGRHAARPVDAPGLRRRQFDRTHIGARRQRSSRSIQPLAPAGFRPAGDQQGRWRQGVGALVTMRDIRVGNRIGTSVLTAYVSLVSAAGDWFPATVARGRRDYGHPVQLAAMVFAGFTSHRSATWDIQPLVIPRRSNVSCSRRSRRRLSRSPSGWLGADRRTTTCLRDA